MTDMPSIEGSAFLSTMRSKTREKEIESRESRADPKMASNRVQHLSTARNLSSSSPAAAVAAESRQPSAIQKPRGPADGRRWLCIAACADRTRSYLAGPVVASSERRQHRAPSGPQALRARTLAPFSTRCREPYLARRPALKHGPRARVSRLPLCYSPRHSTISSLTRCLRMYGNVARRAATGARC